MIIVHLQLCVSLTLISVLKNETPITELRNLAKSSCCYVNSLTLGHVELYATTEPIKGCGKGGGEHTVITPIPPLVVLICMEDPSIQYTLWHLSQGNLVQNIQERILCDLRFC